MTQTTATILPFVSFLASGGGAGILASLLFDALRRRFPQPVVAPSSTVARFAYRAIYAPAYARISAMVLAGIVSVACSALLAFLTGSDVFGAVDVALSAAISAVASQATHALGLSIDMPEVQQ